MFSLNSFAASMLALYIGFSLGLPRPYWAMLTVYITVQPLSGALRSKAVYRVIGTVLGGFAAVALVPNFVNSPFLLSALLAAWVGFCLYLSLLDRTPRSYIFLLAGYTAAIIGFPSVDAPGTVFDTALSRVEEITLGILCATVVHTIFFPRSVLAALNARIALLMRDAEAWVADSCAPVAQPTERTRVEQERRRLAADITELHILSTHLPFDTANLRPTIRSVRALQDRLSLILPLASAVDDRRRALGALGGLPAHVAALDSRVRGWILRGAPETRDEARRLAADCTAAQPVLEASASWSNLIEASLLGRLAELIDALQDARDLAAHIRAPEGRTLPELTARLAGRIVRPLHRDHGLAALSAFAATMAILACCVGWIATAWPDGAIAPMMAAVFSSFFAAQTDPAPAIAKFQTYSLIALPIAAVYLFAILPSIDGFPLLCAVLAPPLLILGAMQGMPSTFIIAMPMLIGIAGALALQEVFTADFAGFANTSIAQTVGIFAALTATRIFRSVGADWSAQRILRFGWRELSANAAAHGVFDRAIWVSRMLDRLGLLLPRLILAERPKLLETADPLNDLRIGLNVADLQEARGAVGPAAQHAIATILGRIAAYFHALGVGRSAALSPALLSDIDGALAKITAEPNSVERRNCLWSLAGLRRNLFPDAPPYAPPYAPGAAA
jgi:uncharacterized membrane protein YccC